MPTTPKINGRNWKRARARMTYYLGRAADEAVLIQQSAHLSVAKERAVDVLTSLNAALIHFNDLVAVVEANDE